MDFQTAVKICLNKYATFSGRAPRSEYWWFFLFEFLASAAGGIVDGALGTSLVAPLVALGLFLPGLAVGFRRLHDVDKSGWWVLIIFVPLIGAILLLVWACTRGTPGPNRFGPDPLGQPGFQPAAA